MCIVCKCGEDGGKALSSHRNASVRMRAAAADMLALKGFPGLTPGEARAYDRAHKKMTRLLREWNRVEQERERPQPINRS